ncbi:MAG: hypothetical protein Q9191_004173 [Dirinaria sp. TL-2023a]
MPPKTDLPAAKKALILSYFRQSMTVHTLKELEKALPSVATINGMQVKDYLQDLTNNNQIHVEKIGSGNWYWSFASEETRVRENELAKLRADLQGVEANVADLEMKINTAREERAGGRGEDREELVKKQQVLAEEVAALRKELAGYADADPGEVERKRKEVEDLKVKAERWTDNLLLLESYILKVMGGDREGMDELRRQVYGEEYVEGEGLAEL